MDNAVRFDGGQMLKNNDYGWSLNQESVDLNSFLYLEKIILAKMDVLINGASKSSFFREAMDLKKKINSMMFDKESGFYYDISIDTKAHIKIQGSEGWHPLWAGLAGKKQVKGVAKVLADEKKFNTYLPFPTIQANHPKFNIEGYWRGPVWVDQVMFGIEGLENYKQDKLAKYFTNNFFEHAGGLFTDESIRETYNPHTGKGYTAYNFSWSAACIIRMILL